MTSHTVVPNPHPEWLVHSANNNICLGLAGHRYGLASQLFHRKFISSGLFPHQSRKSDFRITLRCGYITSKSCSISSEYYTILLFFFRLPSFVSPYIESLISGPQLRKLVS